MRRAVPIELAEDEARDLLLGELSRAEYENAKPTLIDEIGAAIADWLTGLLAAEPGATPPLVPFLIALGVVAVIVAIALIVYGVPRRNRRTDALGGLFGEDERRTAAELRRAGQDAARRSDWSLAIAETYRAIARGLAERELVTTVPGTTAREFAGLAADSFPAEQAALDAAAQAFDSVRYLGGTGARDTYESPAAPEPRLRETRPQLPELAGARG